jgi:hypothetical protein
MSVETRYTFQLTKADRAPEMTVPFSLAELELFERARELLLKLSDQSAKKTDWQRIAYAELSLPWAASLLDRATALKRVEEMKNFMRKILILEYSDTDPTDIAQRPQDFSTQMLEILVQLPRE